MTGARVERGRVVGGLLFNGLAETAEEEYVRVVVQPVDGQDVAAIRVKGRLGPAILGRELVKPPEAQAVDRAGLGKVKGARQGECIRARRRGGLLLCHA